MFSAWPTNTPVLETSARATAVLDTASGQPTSARTNLPEVVIYADALSTGWALDQSSKLTYDLQSRDVVDQGRYVLKATTKDGVGTLYFTLQQGAHTTFRRNKVLGLRFRLSGGNSAIPNDAILVTVVGSNRQPYWVPNDTSVKLDGRVTTDEPLFSETRLYFLNINHTIQPKTWVDVFLWLDDRQYDPNYTYVTGFYLKTDHLDRFYLDNIALITTR